MLRSECPTFTEFAVDDTNLYWIGDSNHIWSCPIAGCGAAPPTELITSNDGKSGLQVDGAGFYWLQADLGNKASVHFCPLSGCGTDSIMVTSNDVVSFALDDGYVYWADTTYDGSLTQNVRRVAKPSP